VDGAHTAQETTGQDAQAPAPVVHLRPVSKASPWEPPAKACYFSAHRTEPDPGRCTVRNAAGEEITLHPCGMPVAQTAFPRPLFLDLWGSGRYVVTFFGLDKKVRGKVIVDIQDLGHPARPTAATPLWKAPSVEVSSAPAVAAAPPHGAVGDGETSTEGDEEELEGDEGDEDDDEAEFARLERENAALRAQLAAATSPARQGAAPSGNPYAVPPPAVSMPPVAPRRLARPGLPPLPAGLGAEAFMGLYMWCQDQARSDASERIAMMREESNHSLALDRQRHSQLMAEMQGHYARTLEMTRTTSGEAGTLAAIQTELREMRRELDGDDEDDAPDPNAAPEQALPAIMQQLGALLPKVIELGGEMLAKRNGAARAPALPGVAPKPVGAAVK
jgi:hypothetical protein